MTGYQLVFILLELQHTVPALMSVEIWLRYDKIHQRIQLLT